MCYDQDDPKCGSSIFMAKAESSALLFFFFFYCTIGCVNTHVAPCKVGLPTESLRGLDLANQEGSWVKRQLTCPPGPAACSPALGSELAVSQAYTACAQLKTAAGWLAMSSLT